MELMYKIMVEDMLKKASNESDPNYDENKEYFLRELEQLFELIYKHYPLDDVQEKLEWILSTCL